MRSFLFCSVHICLTWKHKAKQSREEEEWQTIQRGRRVAKNSALMRLPVPLGLSTIPPPLPLHPQSRAATRKEGGIGVRGSHRPGSKRLYCIQQSKQSLWIILAFVSISAVAAIALAPCLRENPWRSLILSSSSLITIHDRPLILIFGNTCSIWSFFLCTPVLNQWMRMWTRKMVAKQATTPSQSLSAFDLATLAARRRIEQKLTILPFVIANRNLANH